MASVIFHYSVWYTFKDSSANEAGHGEIELVTGTPIVQDNLSKDTLASLEKEIAYYRNHDSVSIRECELLKADIRS